MAAKEKLYTLTEVSKRAGVSMPTLQRYKKLYQDRIPSVGEGRRQRYPKSAIGAIRKLKAENLKKRGRPRKAVAPSAAKARSGSGKRTGKLLTLSEIGRRTGISYPTLIRYVKLYIDQIPHVGKGRKRRFPVAAVAKFAQLRKQSRRGRPPASEGRKSAAPSRRASGTDARLAERIRGLESAQREVARQLEAVLKLLKRPVHVTIQPD